MTAKRMTGKVSTNIFLKIRGYSITTIVLFFNTRSLGLA